MKVQISTIRSEEALGLVGLLLSGGCFSAATLSGWSLLASLGVTESFAVTSGLFSSWLVWAALAVVFALSGRALERERTPRAAKAPVLLRSAVQASGGRRNAITA
jgi:hypothetical protein